MGKAIYALLFGLYVVALAVRLVFYFSAIKEETLIHYAGERVVVDGVIVNDPEHRATSTHVNVKVKTIGNDVARGILLAVLPPDLVLQYGDRVEVSGTLTLPVSFKTDTGREFNYAGYLRVEGISAEIPHGVLEKVSPGVWSPTKFLFEAKHMFEHSLEHLFPAPDGSLMEGVLLGERRGLPKSLNDAFIVSGLVHVVVLSGYNISVVSNAVLYALGFLPRVFRFSFGGVLMILFAIMTGGAATTVRACIMGLIAILGQYLHRPSAALRALVLAALGMVLWNPPTLIYDPSFILSVLATFGLITLSPTVEKYLWFVPERFQLRSIASSTLSVQLFVLPALLYITGILSFVALPANLLALPVVPFAMLFGFLAGLLGLIHPLLGVPLYLIAEVPLQWMIGVATLAQALPFSSTTVPPYPAWVAVGIYIPLTLAASYAYLYFARK
jgi:competence protein ComEC